MRSMTWYRLLAGCAAVAVTAGSAAAAPPQAAEAREQKPVQVAAEFLRLAIAGKDADALKLVVPGTVSENKIGEIRNAGYTRTEFVLVLINDTRVEAVTTEKRPRKADEPEGHLVIMVVKSKDGEWRVKDLDVRDDQQLGPRIALYLAGHYDEKDAKK